MSASRRLENQHTASSPASPTRWTTLTTTVVTALVVALGACPPCYAQQKDPVRTIQGLGRYSAVDSLRRPVRALTQARVALADYALLRRDFPMLEGSSEEAIDRWLLKQAGYISVPQTRQRQVNAEIPSDASTVSGYRPSDYGRALIFEAKSQDGDQVVGLIDSKGAGAEIPQQRHHRNGLATLGECLREFILENGIREALRNAGLTVSTVGSYAVIDAGFDMIHPDGSRSRAGLYLRQGHGRNATGPLSITPAGLEQILNRYGIVTGGNVQLTGNGNIYDFGHYAIGKDIGIESIRFPYLLWGHSDDVKLQAGDTWGYSKADFPWIWSHETAEAFAQGRATRRDVLQHFKNLIQPLREKLDPCGALLRN